MMQSENDPSLTYGVALRTRIVGVCGLALGAIILYAQAVGFNTGQLCIDLISFLLAIFFLLAGAVFLFYQARLTIDEKGLSYSQFGRKSNLAWDEIDHAALTTSKNIGLKNEVLKVFSKTDKVKPTIEGNIALLNSRKEIVESLGKRLGSILRQE